MSMSSNSSSRSRRKSGDSGDCCERQHFEPVLVYCRVRPLQSSSSDIPNVIIKDSTSIILIPPPNIVNSQKIFLEQEIRYGFKRVFGPTSPQNEVYKVVAQPLVENLIRGRNSLLFSYGVTGSGKTYTMTGDSRELGLLPRCLEALFRSIEGFHAQKCIFQPDHLNGFEIVSEAEAAAAARNRTDEKHKLSTTQRANAAAAAGAAPQRQPLAPPKPTESIEFEVNAFDEITPLSGIEERNVYAVFISYTEVYNNCVYDLLEECSVQRCLQSRIVREDPHHNMYVHGVREIEIKSVQEAMEAFLIGQRHKKIGHTVLNAESSRSHSIFNIRLVQAPIGEHCRENKNIITISQLSLVDLAGSERSSRMNNCGARLRETGNINNSLMTLRTCFEYLRENQQIPLGNPLKKIPYRDSKITQLFKNFFEGEGQVSMIACINPRLEDYSENSQVMKFAEITQEICVPRATTTVQLSSNEEDIVNLLKAKFIGCEMEIPAGDGPLSEKVIIMFQNYLETSKRESRNLKVQCENYLNKINELEQQNSNLHEQLEEEQELVIKERQRNKALKEAVNLINQSLKNFRHRVEVQTARLEFGEKELKRAQIPRTSGSPELIQRLKNEHSSTSSIEEILNSTTDASPKKINFKLLNKFIELVERDEL